MLQILLLTDAATATTELHLLVHSFAHCREKQQNGTFNTSAAFERNIENKLHFESKNKLFKSLSDLILPKVSLLSLMELICQVF